MLDDLVLLYAKRLSEIKAICETHGGEVAFDIVSSFYSDNTQAIYFDKDFLEIVHYLSATIQIDMYVNESRNTNS